MHCTSSLNFHKGGVPQGRSLCCHTVRRRREKGKLHLQTGQWQTRGHADWPDAPDSCRSNQISKQRQTREALGTTDQHLIHLPKARKVPHCKNGLPCATFFGLDKTIPRLFSISFSTADKTNTHQIHFCSASRLLAFAKPIHTLYWHATYSINLGI